MSYEDIHLRKCGNKLNFCDGRCILCDSHGLNTSSISKDSVILRSYAEGESSNRIYAENKIKIAESELANNIADLIEKRDTHDI